MKCVPKSMSPLLKVAIPSFEGMILCRIPISSAVLITESISAHNERSRNINQFSHDINNILPFI